jgi:hypothetical protein
MRFFTLASGIVVPVRAQHPFVMRRYVDFRRLAGALCRG